MAGITDFKIAFLTSTQSRFQILNFKLCLFLTASALVRQGSQCEHSEQEARGCSLGAASEGL